MGPTRWWGLALVGLAVLQPCWAKLSPFTICDLHAPPRGKSDGREAPDLRAGAAVKLLPLGERIAACTDALAAPELVPGFWARRTSLIEARAVLEHAAGQRDRALADIDAAAGLNAPRASDRFYARSAGLGVRMLRATVRLDGATRAEAQGDWAAISNERPFDAAVQFAAFRVLWSSEAPFAIVAPVADRLGRLGEAGTRAVIDGLLDMAQPREAVALFDALPPEPPEAAPLGRAGDAPLVQIAKRLSYTELLLRIAYAKAALGDASGSPSLVATARAQGEAWAAEVPTGGGWAKDLARYGVTRDRVTAQVAAQVQAWSAMIAAVHSPDVQAVMAHDAIFAREQLDLLRAALARKSDPDVLARAEMIRVRLAATRKERLDPGLVYGALPPAEAGDNMTPFHQSGNFFHGATGWKAEPQANGTVSVTFTGYVPSHAVAEMALLGAAAAARQAGKPAFVVERLGGYAMTDIRTGAQSDASAVMVVRFVDTASPRALRVDSVEAALTPVFEGVVGPT